MESFDIKGMLSKRRLKMLMYSLVIGLLMVFLFSGKYHADLETVAISSDEQYIAFFETGNGHKISCFHSDGSLAFTYDIPVDISAGGYCTLWFNNDALYVLFYRTDKIVQFALDGTMLNIADNTAEEDPPEFPSFSRMGRKYIFNGNQIDVVYDKRGVLGYWLFGAERYLAITPPRWRDEGYLGCDCKGRYSRKDKLIKYLVIYGLNAILAFYNCHKLIGRESYEKISNYTYFDHVLPFGWLHLHNRGNLHILPRFRPD